MNWKVMTLYDNDLMIQVRIDESQSDVDLEEKNLI